MIPIRAKSIGLLSFLLLAGAGMFFVPSASSELEAQEEKTTTETKPADKTEKPAEKTQTVKAETFRIETELDGVFEATEMTPISLRPDEFQTLEVVKTVPHGAEVKKGDQLVWLETKDLDKQIAETKLAVELGELSLKAAREDLKYLEAVTPLDLAQAERSQMIAERELEQYLETDQPLAVRSAKQSLRNSEGQLENVTEELRQLEKMYKADDLTEETEEIILKRARRSVESAELFFELAKVRADRTLKESIPEQEIRLTEAAQREDLALAKLKISQPIERRQKEIALEKLERSQKDTVEKLDKLEKDRKLLDVKAPASGIVYYGSSQDGKWSSIDTIAKQLEPGKSLTANQVFMTIVQLRPMQIRMSVDEKNLRHLETGATGQAVPTAFPDRKLPAAIVSVAQIPGGSAKFDAIASVDIERDDALVPGMTCKVKLVSYEKKDAIAVPKSAVFHTDDEPDKFYVYIKDSDGKPVKRPVTKGRVQEGKVEITKGLKVGETIFTEKPEDKASEEK